MSLPGRPAVGPPLCLCWWGRCLAGTERSRLSFLNLGRPFTGHSAQKSGFGFVLFFFFFLLLLAFWGYLRQKESQGGDLGGLPRVLRSLNGPPPLYLVESVSVSYHTRGLLVLSGVTGRRRPPPLPRRRQPTGARVDPPCSAPSPAVTGRVWWQRRVVDSRA